MNVKYKNLGFLASHKGTDMQALISACKSGILQATPTVVISNNSHSGAIIKAKREGIPFYNLSSNTHPIPEELDIAILKTLVLNKVDLVILAGYDRKLGIQTLSYYEGRVINIHPSLLPKYGGTGMYGILGVCLSNGRIAIS
jgi:phosphoribosylglycinamide formyltransferase-1